MAANYLLGEIQTVRVCTLHRSAGWFSFSRVECSNRGRFIAFVLFGFWFLVWVIDLTEPNYITKISHDEEFNVRCDSRGRLVI